MSFDNRSSTMDGNSGNQEMQSPSSALCKTGCGFYGDPMQEGLCSKCYKDKVKRIQQNVASTGSTTHDTNQTAQNDSRSSSSLTSSPSNSSSNLEATSSNAEKNSEASRGAESLGEDAASDAAVVNKPPEQASQESAGTTAGDVENKDVDNSSTAAEAGKPKKNRCLSCNKKVGLTGFGCRCGGLYCSTHRYSDMHQCSFDYKEHAQGQIRRNNPVVVGNKIAKI